MKRWVLWQWREEVCWRWSTVSSWTSFSSSRLVVWLAWGSPCCPNALGDSNQTTFSQPFSRWTIGCPQGTLGNVRTYFCLSQWRSRKGTSWSSVERGQGYFQMSYGAQGSPPHNEGFPSSKYHSAEVEKPWHGGRSCRMALRGDFFQISASVGKDLILRAAKPLPSPFVPYPTLSSTCTVSHNHCV